MTPIQEFMADFVAAVEKNCDLDTAISLKELPAGGGLYAEPGEGFADSRYYDRTELRIVPVLILCRNRDQCRCLEQLEEICRYLRHAEYPQGATYSWKDAEIVKNPSKIGRDEDGVYHYSCIMNCKLYF